MTQHVDDLEVCAGCPGPESIFHRLGLHGLTRGIMGDLECGFEEMQGVRLGYLLIQGKQMFALSQVFTELLKNIPRTTVHKRMDHLKVKKHHCDLEELRKLKAINSIAFHAAKCTLISREDVDALCFSCRTERVLRANKRKAKPACQDEEEEEEDGDDDDGSTGFLRAPDAWKKEKVWFSFHGVPETLSLHSRRTPSKLPHFYHKPHARDHRSLTKSDHRHFKNYETAKIPRDYLTLGPTHAAFVSRHHQPLLLQTAMSRRKRRREGGHHHHHHVPPVLLLQQPKTPGAAAAHPAGYPAFHFAPELYIDARGQQPESCYSSDSESSVSYSDRAYPDSDFGSGFSTSSSASGTSDEEDESDSTDVSSEEEEEEEEEEDTSSHSDSSSVSSRVSVQSIRFRRARVGSLTRTQHTRKAPLLLQPTFHYNNNNNHRPEEETPEPSPPRIRSEGYGFEGPLTDAFHCHYGAEKSVFGAELHPGQCDPDTDARGFDKSLNLPLKKIKIEAEDPILNAPPPTHPDTVNAPPFNQHHVKVKVEESCDEYEYSPITHQCKADKTEGPGGVTPQQQGEGVQAREWNPGVAPSSPQDCKDDCEKGNKNGKASGRKSRLPKTKHNVQRVSKTTVPPCEEGSAEEAPSRRKRSSSVAVNGKMPFSLMTIFPSPPSLVVGSDGDLCPAYSLNSLRAPGTPPPSHPVWSWQPGGHINPPPLVHRTRKY